MAKQEIDIGVEGNDGTGDSIRESFRKVNENFEELYAVFGAGGQISFTNLGDTPNTIPARQILLSDDSGNALSFVEIGSDSDVTPGELDSVIVNYDIPGKIILRTSFRNVFGDPAPVLGGPLNAFGRAIANVKIDQDAVNEWNDKHDGSQVTIDDLVITKGYADARYIAGELPIRVDDEPLNADEYTLTIIDYDNGNLEVPSHGFDRTINGTPYQLEVDDIAPGALPATLELIYTGQEQGGVPTQDIVVGRTYKITAVGNIDFTLLGSTKNVVGQVFTATSTLAETAQIESSATVKPIYFLRYYNTDQLSVYYTAENAKVQTFAEAEALKINISHTIDAEDNHSMLDAGYDPDITGFFLSNEALPRKSIVRRQGDTMTGPLILHDSPGELSGITADPLELQAATKFYVDNTSYSSPTNLFVSTTGDDKMRGVPAGKEGTSFGYAYKSINAAAQRAAEIIKASEAEPGPYMQTILKNGVAVPVIESGFNNPVYDDTRQFIQENREFIIREITAYLNYTYPNFNYNIDTCERDLGLILDAIAFDITKSLSEDADQNNANSLTRKAAERYYANSSGRIAITRQFTETVDAINTARDIVAAILLNRPYRQTPILNIENSLITSIETNQAHGLQDKNIIKITDVTNLTDLNDNFYYVKVVTNNKFEIFLDEDLTQPVDTTALPDYNLGGGQYGVVYQTDEKQYFNDTFDSPENARTGVNDKFNLIVNILTNGIDAGAVTNFGRTYNVVVDSGVGATDQGDISNRDVLPGKVLVGKISGAQGRIVSYTAGNDPTSTRQDGADVIEVHLIKPIDFIAGEDLEYGNFVNRSQVTIFIESGQYEEDYPIKIAANVSLKGDEFRRVIIRPKDRVSQSQWADTYTYRDRYFDGLELTKGGYRFYNQTNEFQGHFGYHYLANPEKPRNTGSPVVNGGGKTNAAAIIKENKKFIQEEIIQYINQNVETLLYDHDQFDVDLAFILSNIGFDIPFDTNYNQRVQALRFQRSKSIYLDPYLQQLWVTGLQDAKIDVLSLPQISASATAVNRISTAFDTIINVIQSGTLDTNNGVAALYMNPVAGVTTTSQQGIWAYLDANREFIAQEGLAKLKEIAPRKYFDEAVRLRDFRDLTDALAYDLHFGGNSGSVTFATDLFIDDVLRLELNTRQETLDVITHLKSVIADIIQGNAVTATTGNAESQTTGLANSASPDDILRFNDLIDIVYDQINFNSLLTLPTRLQAGTAGTDPTLTGAQAELTGAVTILQESTKTVIDNAIVFNYNVDKCKRDVGLIVNGIVSDLIEGGSENALQVQGEYFESYIQQYNNNGFGGQENVTKNAILYTATIMNQLLTGTYPDNLQWQDSQDADYIAPDFKYGTGESGTSVIIDGLVDKIVFVFNRAYNPPLRNDQMDCFLMNDATILRNITVQGHGGFLCVLDPDGQILTKSPYVQTGSSFSKSINAKTFAGGMFVDAYVGNLPVYIPQTIQTELNGPIEPGKINNFTLWIRSEEGQGLFIREPQLPCPFYIEGRRFQVNAISDYSQSNGWAKIYLDATSNDGAGYDENLFDENPGEISRPLFLQTAGNRSMLGNDFTQINDLGYALVTTNGAFSEMVSMFTYYCHAAYYAANGSEIRSLNGSNGYGNFGLVAEGADPNEIPDQVTLEHDMAFPAKTVTFLNGADNTNIKDSTSLFVTDMRQPPNANSLVQINHPTEGILRYRIGAVTKVDPATFGLTITGNEVNNDLYRLQITGEADGENGDFFSVIREDIPDGTFIEYRNSITHKFNGVRSQERLETRPSTAINFDESDEITYRSVSFAFTDNFSNNADGDSVYAQFDVPYDYISLPVNDNGVSGGNGSAPGDTNIAISTNVQANLITQGDLTRLTYDLAGNSPTARINENAAARIANNIKFVAAETVAYANTLPGLTYDELTCYRDVQLILHAVVNDLLHNGTAKTVFAAREYFEQVTELQIPSDQVTETIQALQFARDLVMNNILTGTPAAVNNNKGYTQNTGGSAEANADAKVFELMNIITDGITNGYTSIPQPTGYSGGMIFSWDGRTHQIIGVLDDTRTFTTDNMSIGETYEITSLDDSDWNTIAGTSNVVYQVGDTVTVANIEASLAPGGTNGSGFNVNSKILELNPAPAIDITSNPNAGINTAVPIEKVFYAGLQQGTTAEITVSISLCRATGHDFTQIGTGGFNTSNYPNVILGPPVGIDEAEAPFHTTSPDATKAQVWERRKGRVFWMSTDQYGFFRVGQFFSVDQAQGSIQFSGEIGITGANAIGFKKGVPVDEFSVDDTMGDNSDSAVPVEQAIVGYINKRLGRDKNNTPVSGKIGPGFLDITGLSQMEGTLQMGNNRIIDVGTPSQDSDAATKSYVDTLASGSDSLDSLRNFSTNNPQRSDLMVITGTKIIVTTPPVDSSGNQTFAIGNTIRTTGGDAESVITDIITSTDPLLGNPSSNNIVWTIYYNPVDPADDFALGETVTRDDDTSVTATILKGPFDEIAHSANNAGSDVSIEVTRSSNIFGTPGSTDPISTVNVQLREEVVENADISPSAAIAQSKLALKRAAVKADSSLLFGLAADTVGQTYRGLSVFDDANFTEELKLTLNASISADAGDVLYQNLKEGVVVNTVQNSTVVYIKTSDNWEPSGTSITKSIIDSEGVIRAPQNQNVSVISVEHSGYIGLKDRSVSLEKLDLVSSDVVLGRFNSGTGLVEEVPFDTVVDQGFALQDKDFDDSEITVTSGQRITFSTEVTVADGTNVEQDVGGLTVTGTVQGAVYSENTIYVVNNSGNFSTGQVFEVGGDLIGTSTGASTKTLIGKALVEIDPGVYGTTSIATSSTGNTIARRNASGSLRATSYLLGGSDDNEVLALDLSGNVRLKTVSQGTILYASGGNDNQTPTNPVVNIPGNLDVGETGVTQSNFQTNSNDGAQNPTNTFGGKGFVSTNWLYTPFIEAPGERDGNGTGIGIGGNTGFGNADTIQFITDGSERMLIGTTGVGVTGTLSSSGALTSGGDLTVGSSFSVTHADGSLSAGATSVTSLTSTGAVSGTSGSFSGAVSGTSGTFAGSVSLGTNTTQTVSINGTIDTSLIPSASTKNIGSNANPWGTVYGSTFSGTATSAKYADLAENYLADADYEPGTVLVLGGTEEVTTTTTKGDTRVAGVVTTDPAHLMNSALEGNHVVGVALSGRVPCKVLGKVRKGDLLVTSAIQGYAIVDNNPKYGTIIGKAISDKTDDNKGVIEVLVGKS